MVKIMPDISATSRCSWSTLRKLTRPPPQLLNIGAISVARSFIPANRCAVDKTIEETLMRYVKSQAGPGGRGAGTSYLLNNYEAYRRWARTTHERSTYVEVMLQMANMSDDGSGRKHCVTQP